MKKCQHFKLLSLCFIFYSSFGFSVEQSDSNLLKAINGKHRTVNYVARDTARHPIATLKFFGVEADSTVVEIWPGGGGWYTEILAPYLKDNGKLFVAGYDPELKLDYYIKNTKKFAQKLASDQAVYGAVMMTAFNPEKNLEIAPQGSASHVLTFRNVHNWKGRGDKVVANAFAIFFKALKPGGVLGLVEHRMPESFNPKDDDRSGYVKQSYVIKMAEQAGFILDAKSEINANPNDTADHPKGVWSLPPSYRMKDVDRQKYEATGESDRMTLRFVKALK